VVRGQGGIFLRNHPAALWEKPHALHASEIRRAQ
jgi:hypothetical protein